MELYNEIIGSGKDIVFLHGLFGDGRNLMNIARSLSGDFRCILVDHRNHGNSPHAKQFSYKIMADDLKDTLDKLGVNDPVIIGHSMGGKTAMEYALSNQERVRALVCMDQAAGSYRPRYSGFVETMKAFRTDVVTSRSEAERFFTDHGVDEREARFLLKNLVKGKKGYNWRINLDSIIENYHHIWEGVGGGESWKGPVLVLKGELSDFIRREDEEYFRTLFPSVQIKTVPNAGHWLHVDNPAECIAGIRNFLSTI